MSLTPASSLVLAFGAADAWRLYEALPLVGVWSEQFIPLLFVVLSFCLFLRPDSLLSVLWARVSVIDGEPTFQYKPLNWKGRIVAPENAPVLQFPLCSLPSCGRHSCGASRPRLSVCGPPVSPRRARSGGLI